MRQWVRTDDPAVTYARRTLESGGKQRTRKDTTKVYRIVVRGELSARYAAAFEGMEMEAASGRTTLTGEVVDQSRLQGILERISGLGLELVSVLSVSDEPQNDTELSADNR
jgi:hypothetical protein